MDMLGETLWKTLEWILKLEACRHFELAPFSICETKFDDRLLREKIRCHLRTVSCVQFPTTGILSKLWEKNGYANWPGIQSFKTYLFHQEYFSQMFP